MQPWHRNAVVYQIYPRSFKDTNGDGIGDLAGIIKQLDYLNDGTETSLGIGALWLSPIYRSPMVDGGYDVLDHSAIDPRFGDLATFDQLVTEAHRRGIKVIMDFVANHTSHEHPWFLEARSSRDSPKRDWYIWRDPKSAGLPPNNWLSVFGGPAWTFDAKTRQYYLHSFFPEQPDLNWRNPEVEARMREVMRFWLDRGVDGFRVDAVLFVAKDSRFRDDPPNPSYRAGKDDPFLSLRHMYSLGGKEVTSLLEKWCEIVAAKDDGLLVSEVDLPLSELRSLYCACANHRHLPFNFNLMRLPWSASWYRTFIDHYEASLSPEDLPNYVLGNHDRPRVATRLGQSAARLSAMLLLTLRGLPFIYYGDELGMEDVMVPPDEVKDPWEFRIGRFGTGRDPARTPMQWDGSRWAGFSQVKPWLPLEVEYQKRNVAAESRDPHSFLTLYRTLIHVRNSSPALTIGTYRSLLPRSERNVLAFARECPAEKLLVVLNFSSHEEMVSLGYPKASVICTTGLDIPRGEVVDPRKLTLRPSEGYLLRIE
ncbi:MAG: alpha-glucosidase C-terminal domain-containing protein [Parcubacteria group bacterium]|nr:alpha-glucosidase C-terminal domain-containing protein [Parcubacteria group bacterium]